MEKKFQKQKPRKAFLLLGGHAIGRGIGFGGGGSNGGVLGFHDSFTDTNGTSLSSHKLDTGGSYTVLKGTGQIQTNQLESNTSGTALEATAQAGLASGSISINVAVPASGQFSCGLFLRGSDKDHGLIVALQNDGGSTTAVLVQCNGTM